MAHSSSKIYVKSNIGLGTASPLEMLHVYNSGLVDVRGILEVSSVTKSPQFKFKSPTTTHTIGQETSSSGVSFTGSTPNSLCIYTGGAQSLHLGTNNTSRLEITSSGNINLSGYFTTNGVTVGSALNTISGLATIVNTGTLTLPTSTDTLVGRATSDALSNKTISLSTNTFSSFTTGSILFTNASTITQDNTNLFWDNTNKRLGVGTAAPGYRIDASTGAVYANSVIMGSAANTISGLATIINTGTLTLPTSTDTLIGRITSDTLTNKSMSGASNTFSNIGDGSLSVSYLKADGTRALTGNWGAGSFSGTFNSVAIGSAANTISGLATIINTGTLTLPTSTDTLVGRATSDALSNKTMSLSTNTFSGFTAGSILFHNGTTITQNNGNLFWDNVNNRLGIGTTGPGYKIDVQGGSINASAGIYDNGVRLFGRPALGQQVSADNTGAVATNSYVDIVGLTVTLTTTGRPVMIVLQPNTGYAVGARVEVSSGGGQGITQLLRDATPLYYQQYYNASSGNVGFPGGMTYIDVVGAGTYTYKMQLKKGSGPGVTHANYTLVAYEL